MFHRDRFKEKVKERQMTLQQVAEVLCINEATLYRKMCGKSEFTRHEIEEVKKCLCLTMDECEYIFFV